MERLRWDHLRLANSDLIERVTSGLTSPYSYIAQLFRVGQRWLEIEMAFILFGNAYLNCMVAAEIRCLDSWNVGHEDINSSGVDRDQLVLVDITKFVQLPKRMIVRRTRYFVRLKGRIFVVLKLLHRRVKVDVVTDR
jgi:hypothetical protein